MCIWVNQALPLASSKRWKRPKALKGYGKGLWKQNRSPAGKNRAVYRQRNKIFQAKSSKRMKANMLIPKRKEMRPFFFWSKAVPNFKSWAQLDGIYSLAPWNWTAVPHSSIGGKGIHNDHLKKFCQPRSRWFHTSNLVATCHQKTKQHLQMICLRSPNS